MKKLLDQAVKLNYDLTVATQEAIEAKAEANQLAASARILKGSLDAQAAELADREKAMDSLEKPIKAADEARRLKTENVLECSKIEKARTDLADKEKAFTSKQAKAAADLNTREADVNAERDENRKIREALKEERTNMKASIIAELQGK